MTSSGIIAQPSLPRLTRWSKHTVNISPAGDVTLRTPSGRSTGWFGGSRKDPDAAAADWLETFQGSTLVDKRKPRPRQINPSCP